MLSLILFSSLLCFLFYKLDMDKDFILIPVIWGILSGFGLSLLFSIIVCSNVDKFTMVRDYVIYDLQEENIAETNQALTFGKTRLIYTASFYTKDIQENNFIYHSLPIKDLDIFESDVSSPVYRETITSMDSSWFYFTFGEETKKSIIFPEGYITSKV